MKCFLINLDQSKERLQSVEACFVGNTPPIRVSATDGRICADLTSLGYSRTANRKDYGRLLIRGEIGCYHSHLNAVQEFLRTTDDFCVVLEDDAVVAEDFFNFLESFLAAKKCLPDDFRVMNISKSADSKYTLSTEVEFTNPQVKLMRTLKFPTIARGLIYSRIGAEDLIRSGSVISKPFDHFLQDWLSRKPGGYCLSRPFVGNAGFESDIGSGNRRREQPLLEGLLYDFVVAKRDTVNDLHFLKRRFLTKK